MPVVLQGAHSMRQFVWHWNMWPMSKFLRVAMRMVRAASSGDELDVLSAKMAEAYITIFFFFVFFLFCFFFLPVHELGMNF